MKQYIWYVGIFIVCVLAIRMPVYGLDPGLLPPRDAIQITLPTATPTPTIKFMIPDKSIRISIAPLSTATPTQTTAPLTTTTVAVSPTPDSSLDASSGANVEKTESTPSPQGEETKKGAVKSILNKRDMGFFGIIGALALIILVILFFPKRKKESDGITEEQT